ncbi:MAG TPA: DnaA/Hda family protein [Stellaceae bacterium]|jgi:chromosomal replication initiation ATPase DnaA|nr:DnaA/Hda family protein [Stellaceae bacterium]
MRQGTFDLPVEPQYHCADFLVSDSNRAAFELVERWPDWRARAVVLHGAVGCGKTHLAHLWCARSGAPLVQGRSLSQPEDLPASVAVDDADRGDERALLHLYNLTLERGGSLLLTMPVPPARLKIGLADLGSRLRSLPVAGIAPPDDELLKAVLAKHFADRQLRVAPEVLAYLVARIERSFAAAADIAARLDRLGLETRRAVTIKLARAVLGEAQ